jgi:hypothetical protein
LLLHLWLLLNVRLHCTFALALVFAFLACHPRRRPAVVLKITHTTRVR